MSVADEEQCARMQDSHAAMSLSLVHLKENHKEPVTLFWALSVQVDINVAGKRAKSTLWYSI